MQIKRTGKPCYMVIYEKDSKRVINKYNEKYNGEEVAFDDTKIGYFESTALAIVEKYIKDNGLIVEDLTNNVWPILPS